MTATDTGAAADNADARILTDVVVIGVSPAGVAVNAAPVVNAGGDLSVAEGAAVVLTGTAADDSGDAPSLVWSQVAPVSGAGAGVLAGVAAGDLDGLVLRFNAPNLLRDTRLSFRLAATDAGTPARTGADVVDVWVMADDDAPTAAAGISRSSAPAETTVTLVGGWVGGSGRGGVELCLVLFWGFAGADFGVSGDGGFSGDFGYA